MLIPWIAAAVMAGAMTAGQAANAATCKFGFTYTNISGVPGMSTSTGVAAKKKKACQRALDKCQRRLARKRRAGKVPNRQHQCRRI